MPVNRAYINGYATSDLTLYQALVALANQSDALEKLAGVSAGTSGATAVNQVNAPPAAQWTITAANGHFLMQITTPASATAPVQHQVRTATDGSFGASSSTTAYTLGVGEGTRDIVAPQQTLYFQLRSRYQGSDWNSWAAYTTSAGVTALSSGALGGLS